MRKEIEVKARVSDLESVATKLEALGCKISEPITQNDIIFADDKQPFDMSLHGRNFLRIRQGNGKILFTIKQTQSNELDCLEHEVEVNDANEMKEAILLMGYYEAVQVNKTRRKTSYNGCEICLDEVEGLGSFMEMEKITDDEDAEKVQDELFAFLLTLGVQKEDRIIKGYDTLVYLKQHENNQS